ncbi:acetyltransferase [Streptomyces seoulensis]|nr:acetyltransferase [Streptomyces seoulensis]
MGEQGVPQDIEYDAYDASAVHVLAVDEDGVPLGTGRLLHGEAAAAKTGGDASVGSLGRLAVTRRARGLGVGAALVRAIEDAARSLGLTAVDLHAQTQALGFYERLGYTAYGPEFQDAGIAHRAMRRPLGPA